MLRTTATTPSPKQKRAALHLELLEDRRLLSVFSPAQIAHAYGFDQVTFANGTVRGTGAGQTIAIIDAYDDPNIAGDLQTFDRTFGLPDPTFIKVTPQGLPKVDAGWSAELALDVEWAHALAPAAHILLVEAKSNSASDLLSAVNYAVWAPGVSVVSMSWNSPEFASEASYDSHFGTPTGHTGVTFVASAGDTGAPAQWPAVSPRVVAVGGTSLTLGPGNSYGSETAWGSGSGGISPFETKPGFQALVPTPSTAWRTSPDVAFNANSKTGVYVYDSVNGAWFADGGTSAGAPQWAALVAIANQGRILAGSTALDGPSQTLYALYAMGSSTTTTYFHDITTGSNGNAATPGYDLVTGLGSPLANQVISGLVAWTGTGSTGSLVTGGHTSPPGVPKTSARPALTYSVVVPGALADSGEGIALARWNVTVRADSPVSDAAQKRGDAVTLLRSVANQPTPVHALAGGGTNLSGSASHASALLPDDTPTVVPGQAKSQQVPAPRLDEAPAEPTHERRTNRVGRQAKPLGPTLMHASAVAHAPTGYLADSGAVALVLFSLSGPPVEARTEPKARR